MDKMTIAIDYDGTYTRDPQMWNKIIRLFKEKGHRVVCATMRYPETVQFHNGHTEAADVLNNLAHLVDEVYFTSRQAKAPFLKEKGVHVDIWVDDNPRWLYENSR